jgi:hypothetical protein
MNGHAARNDNEFAQLRGLHVARKQIRATLYRPFPQNVSAMAKACWQRVDPCAFNEQHAAFCVTVRHG